MAGMEQPEKSNTVKLLSLDGGGIRGLSSLIVLKHLMKRINLANPPKPCDYFDLIGGTSTGGLIAIMLGRLHMSVDECIEKYLKLSEAAFSLKRVKSNVFGRSKDIWKASGKYQSEVLAEQFMRTTGLVEGDEQASFYEPNGKCKVFVCAHSKANNTPVNIRSYTTSTSVDSLSLSQCKIWEAARATSAASGFFDPIKIGWQDYVDGATGRNNPVEEVFNEAKGIWSDAPSRIQCFVSIGTGIPEPKDFGENLAEIKKAIIAITTETEDTERRFYENHESFGLGGRYFRFNVDRGLRDVSLDEFDKVGKIMIATESYLNGPRVQDIIKKFAQVFCMSSDYATVAEKQKNDYLNWLPYLDPRSTHNDARRYRTDSTTGNWFLENSFKEWKTKSNSFMWLHAKAGSGKTILSSTIIDHLEKQSEGTVAFFYFSYHMDKDQAYLSRLFRISLILQILKPLIEPVGPNSSVPRRFRELYHKYQPSQDPSDEDLDAILRHLLDLTPQTYIVVDALDECSPSGDQLEVIETLGTIPLIAKTECHIIVTSRKEQGIEEAIRDLPLEKTIIPFDIGEVNSDISHHLLNVVKSKPYSKWPPELQREVIDYLVSRAEGVFRWADLQIRALAGQVREKDVRRALSRLPQGLEATYERMLKKIDDDNKFEEAYAIFRWIAFSTTRLNLAAVSELAAFEIDDPECLPESNDFSISFSTRNRFDEPTAIQNLLSSLVIIPDVDNPYQTFPSFAHSTVLEYLMSPRVSPTKFHLDRLDAYWFILKSSWAYMVHYDASPQPSKSKPYPLLEYACYQVWECALELVQWSISLKSQISEYLASTSMEGLVYNGTTLKFSIWWFCHRMGLPESLLAMTLLDLLGSTEFLHKTPSWSSLYSVTSIDDGTLLIDAAAAGESIIVKLLLDMRPIKENLCYLEVALRSASRKPTDVFKPYQSIIAGGDNTSVLTQLLKVGANVNDVNGSGDAAIHLAAAHGHIDIVTFLTEWQGVHLDSPNCKGQTPLLLASKYSHTAVVALLLGLSVSVSHRGDEECRTPLSWAATSGNKAPFDLLHRDQNVDVNKEDCRGRTPFIWATIAGQEDIIKDLLTDPRVEPDVRDHFGRTAVSWAALGGHYLLLETLWLDTRVTKYPCDYEGRDLLSYACGKGHTSLVNHLLSTVDLDINRPDYYQRTPLIWARLGGHSHIEKLLLDDPRVLNLDPETSPALVTASLQLPDEYISDKPMTPLASTEATEQGDTSDAITSKGMSISRMSTVDGVGSEIWCLVFSQDGGYLAVCGACADVLIWDVHAGRPRILLRGQNGAVVKAAWGPNSSTLLTCSRDGYLCLWDVESAVLLRCSRHISGEDLSQCAWMPDNRSFLAGCLDKLHGFMKGAIDVEAPTFWETKHRVQFFQLFADGKRLAAIDDVFTLFIYTTDDQNLELKIRLPSRASSLSVSKDLRTVLVRLSNGRMLLIDVASGAIRALSPDGTASNYVIWCCFGGRDESLVITGGEDGYIFIWDRATGNLVFRVKAHSALCNGIAVHPSCSSLFASCSDDGTFAFWRINGSGQDSAPIGKICAWHQDVRSPIE